MDVPFSSAARGAAGAVRGTVSRPESQDWLKKFARLGHLAKGVVYLLIGVLALMAAFGSGGRVSGGQEAASYLAGLPGGPVLLALTGFGLLGYAAWRFIEAWKDPDREGSDTKGVVKRVGFAASGVVNAAIAVGALQLAFGRGTSSGGEQAWASQLLTVPFGQFLLGAIGIGVIVAGLSQLKEAKDERFKRVLKLHQMSRKERTWVTRLAKIGLCARGVVFPLIGYGILRAAMANSAARAQGFGGALREIASKPFGQVLLIAVAAGLVAYGIYMLAVAKYRRLAT